MYYKRDREVELLKKHFTYTCADRNSLIIINGEW